MPKIERTMMKGSENHLDYLIIATRGNTALGIKPILAGDSKRGVTFVLRVRAAFLPSAPHAEKVKGADWKEIWPELAWERLGAERASCVLICPSGKLPWEVDAIIDRAKDAGHELVQFLFERIDDIAEPGDAMVFVILNWCEMLTAMKKVMPQTPKIVDAEPKVYYAKELYGDAVVEPV